jgi:DNA-directed RNA polymerase subunit RPC12/RpoP
MKKQFRCGNCNGKNVFYDKDVRLAQFGIDDPGASDYFYVRCPACGSAIIIDEYLSGEFKGNFYAIQHERTNFYVRVALVFLFLLTVVVGLCVYFT